MGAGRSGRGRGCRRRRRRHRCGHPHREPQPPVGHRALPGRGDRCRWHPARHLLDGRAADRADGSACASARSRTRAPGWIAEGVVAGISATATRSVCRPSAARPSSTSATPTTRSSTSCASGCCRWSGLVLGRAEGVGNLAVLLGLDDRPRRHRRRVRVLASAGFSDDESDAQKRPSVQVGDPYEEKRLIEACLELLDRKPPQPVCRTSAGPASPARPPRRAAKGGAGMDVMIAPIPQRRTGNGAVRGHDLRSRRSACSRSWSRPTSTRCWRSAAKWEIPRQRSSAP